MKATRNDEISQAAIKACRLLYENLGKISPQVFDEEISDECKLALQDVIDMLDSERKERHEKE